MKMKLLKSCAGHIVMLFALTATFNACWDEETVAVNDTGATKARKVYQSDVEVAHKVAGNLWTYTLTQTGKKSAGHFIIDMGNCGNQSASLQHIISASVNGVDWSDRISDSEGNTGCGITSTNFVKFDELPEAQEVIIEFALDTIYAEVITQGWIKSGNACMSKQISGPGCRGYLLTSSMEATGEVAGKPHTAFNTYMKTFGFDYTEHPHCNGGFGGHADATHINAVEDLTFNKPVFRFDIHIDPVIDGDRCSSTVVDRQRNEMKSVTNNTTWSKVQGNWDEWQILEWKFKLPAGFQPTANFCHIHQLKAQDGPNNGNPVITITPRANSDGSNKRMQIIHTIDGATTDKGTVVNNIPLSDFENEWVQVREEMHYTHNGFYSCKITRVRDGKVLIDFTDSNIDLWPSGSSYVRHKYGLYRSLSGGRLDRTPVGQSPLLKNESILITDFRVYEKNTSASPNTPRL